MLYNFVSRVIQKDIDSVVDSFSELVSLIIPYSISEKLHLIENNFFCQDFPDTKNKQKLLPGTVYKKSCS